MSVGQGKSIRARQGSMNHQMLKSKRRVEHIEDRQARRREQLQEQAKRYRDKWK